MLFGKTTFVVFEGLDGSGKTTLSEAVAAKLAETPENKFVTMREPGCKSLPAFDEVLRGTLADENIDQVTEILLHAAYRRENVSKFIKPNLDGGVSVITDRFMLSTWCLNVYPFKDEQPELADLFMGTSPYVLGQGIPEPITFFIDIPMELSRERLAASGKNLDRYEADEAYQATVHESYMQVAQSPSVVTLDGTKPVSELVDDVIKVISDYNAKKLAEIEEMRLALEAEPEVLAEEPNVEPEVEGEAEPVKEHTLTVEEAAHNYLEHILVTIHRIGVQSQENPAADEYLKYRDIIKDILSTVLDRVEDPIETLTSEEGRKELDDQILPVIIYKHRFDKWEEFLKTKKEKAE